jgi:phage terminase large subunit
MTSTATQSSKGIFFDTKVVRSTLGGLTTGEKLIIQQGGTSSGKTFGVLVALYLYAMNSEKSLVISVVGCTVPHLKRGALRQFEEITEKLGGVKNYNRTDKIFQIGNSMVEFFSADDNDKVRGSKRDVLFVNEANLLNYERYRQLAIRTDKVEIIDFNPVGEFWLHEKILPFQKYLFKRTTYQDNPAVGEKVIADIERLKHSDPQLYRIYAEGKTGKIQGLVFPDVKTVDDFPKEAKKIAYGLDFGFTNDPTALIRAGVLHGGLFVEELIYETGLTNQDISKELERLGVRRSAEIFADAAEPKSIEELRREGWNVRAAKKGKDSILYGINLLKQYQKNFTVSSVNLLKEARSYKWKEDRDGKSLNMPIDDYNHAFDALRYYAVMKLKNTGPVVRFVTKPQ